MCGDCCRGYGGTYVTESDIQAIADYLHEDPKRFKSKYCQLSGSRYVLAQADNGYCIFWDKLCRIHPVKPRMCRNWPYLSAVLADIANWRVMGNSCPGIRTDFPDDVIRRAVARQIEKRRNARLDDEMTSDPESGE
jgi:Fe-S-cluster containining protein